MRAKLIAFLKSPVTTLTLYKAGDTAIDARYARAIAYYRIPDLAHALPLMDGLIAERPNDPYFHEMKGQILFDNGRVKESVPEYQAAVRLLGNSPLIRIELGQAEMEAGDDSLLPDALVNLKAGTMGEPDSVDGWRLLSAAYNRSNDPTMAETALAEYSLQTGAWSDAVGHSERALKQLKAGTPIELRMEDVRVQAQQMRDRAQN
jgi:predicted Zn-dependent protease